LKFYFIEKLSGRPYRSYILLLMFLRLLNVSVKAFRQKYRRRPSTVFTRESSYCFQRVLAIAILSVRLSVRLSHWWISQKRCKLGSPNLYLRLP